MAKDLNEMATERIAQKIAKGMVNVEAATNRLIQEGKISRDFVFEVGTTRKGVTTNITFEPDKTGKVGAIFNMPKTGPERYTLNHYALGLLADKLKVPAKYLTGLLLGEEWQKTLAYEIMNTHNGWMEREQMLVRAVGTEVRAFLSDSYRILDSEMIFGTHIDQVFECGGVLSDGFMNDIKLMVESILPVPIELHTPLNGIVMLAFGTRIATSDYGAGKLTAASFILQPRCLNGLVTENLMKEVHLGGRLQGGSNGMFSRETIDLDSRAMASAIRDITKNLYSSRVIKDKMLMITQSASVEVDPVSVLGDLKQLGKLLKGETDQIGELLMRNDPNNGLEGQSTLWKISQGITAYANDPEIEMTRRMELQEIAGDLFKK